MFFHDRAEAGDRLAEHLQARSLERPVVLGIARGGVVVAARVARALHAELGAIVVRRIYAPGGAGPALGAVASDGSFYLDEEAALACEADPAVLESEIVAQTREAQRRQELLCVEPMPALEGRTVIIVDDGIVSGSSAFAAVAAARKAGAANVIVAAPVGATPGIERITPEVDGLVCLERDGTFTSLGQFYMSWKAVDDGEVRALLSAASATLESAADAAISLDAPRPVRIAAAVVELSGDLQVPEGAQGIVLFAHGSGSARHSLRNRLIAKALSEAGLATLLLDLLTLREEAIDERTHAFRSEVGLLGERLVGAARWVAAQPALGHLPIGVLGAGAGGAAAIVAAASAPGLIRAVVSRGGRPDLAGDAVALVEAPTLLIVGERDAAVLEMNRMAHQGLRCERRLHVVPGASHHFDEPGAVADMTNAAKHWFLAHVCAPPDEAAPSPRPRQPSGSWTQPAA